MDHPGHPTHRRPRWGTLALVALLHLAVIAGLVRVFAPDIAGRAAREAASVLISITPHQPSSRIASSTPDAGASAAAGKKTVRPRVSAPDPVIPIRPSPVPPAISPGVAPDSGASVRGQAAGAGGAGQGGGASGDGQGNGAATKAALISGAIDAAKDFPIPPGGRQVREGRSVIVALTVGTDGVPAACNVYRSSGLPDTDQRTCDLAMERLRFRPATNAREEPVVSTFYWQQRFFR